MRDSDKAWETLLATQNSKLAQKLADVQKHVAAIRKTMTKYPSKLSSDIELGCEEFCRRFLDSACENIQSHQEGIEGSVTGTLASFEQIFPTLESELAKQLTNA